MEKDYEVVISGVSGTFPECLNLQELEDNLYNDQCFVNDTNAKWKTTEVPRHLGKIKKCVKFDDTFFGIHRKLTIVIDPNTKHSFEKTYEAISDAGRNPRDFYGSNTAVLISSNISETEGENMLESKHIGHLLLGYSRCMQSNRVSYIFNFKGPSVTLMGFWENGMTAMELARNLVAKGHVRQVIVGATNMTFYPQISRHYQSMGKLNSDGKTKSFSADADGYSRSDSIVVFFLQRAEDALRSYGTIVKTSGRTSMNNNCGIMEPFGLGKFLGDFYSDIPIKNSEIAYIQGDGCATLRTDSMELEALSEVLCPGRTKPLPVTSCKPKLGHAEGASPMVSIVNALIAMKSGYIPPLLHLSNPNPHVAALKDGRIKLVTEKTPLEGDYVGVTSIGFCSSFGHILLKRNTNSRPTPDPDYFPEDGVPRLFLLSGRDEDLMKGLLRKVENAPIDDGFYSLNHLLFKTTVPKHLYRGYAIKTKNKNVSAVAPYAGGEKRPLWFIFSGMGSQWPEMGKAIMEVPIMRRSIERSHKVLESKGLDLISIINDPDAKTYDTILHCFVGIAAIQIALVDLLDELGVKADGFVGHSVGELGCSYADRCLTAEQMILAAYYRGMASIEAKLIKGMMAAVGQGYNDLRHKLPEGIEIACHNSEVSCTLSGPAELMKVYVAELKSKGIFAKLVNVADIAYHSKNIAPAAPLLLKYLQQVIPEPKQRSSKWISSSIPQSKWNTDLARYCSAEYHTNNLLSYVLFEEASAFVPENAICVEIAPHGLLQAIVKKSLPTCTHISLTNRGKENCDFTFESLALLYSCGVELDLAKIYPKVEFPLPRETEYLHPFITWNHTDDWDPISLERDLENNNRNTSNKEVKLYKHPEHLFEIFTSYRICDRTVYPPTYFMSMIMEYMTEKVKNSLTFKCYEFLDLKFHDHLVLEKTRNENVSMLYQSGMGNFEIVVGDTVLLSGQINPLTTFPDTLVGRDMLSSSGFKQSTTISEESIYQFFQEKDCSFNNEFRNIVDIKIIDKGFVGKVKWRGNADIYIDAILKLMMFYDSIKRDRLMEVVSVNQLIFDPSALPQKDKDILVFYDADIGHLAADGVRASFIKTRPANLNNLNPEIEKRIFQSYSNIKSVNEFLQVCLHTISELSNTDIINVVKNEKCKLFEQMVQSKYFYNMTASKRNIKIIDCNEAEMLNSQSHSNIYFFVSDEKLSDSLIKVFDSTKHNCYLVQSANKSDIKSLTKFKQHTPVIERDIDDNKLVFYKKTINAIADANFIQVPNGYLLEKPDNKDDLFETKKTNIFLFNYDMLSDISYTLDACKTHMESKNVRFVFTDKNAPIFDPTNNFYQLQLKKDIKVSICHNGLWGTLKDVYLTVPVLQEDELQECQTPLNKIRCDAIDVKYLGLNLQDLVKPSQQHKLGVLDYSGVKKGGDEVMGLGRLSSDNTLDVDPVLAWRKPNNWTIQQAASVPFFYSLSYYLLRIKCLPDVKPRNKVFIHGGHTAFSQAVISVAMEMKTTVYTTCFTQQQKMYILKRFPQIEESKVFVLDKGNKFMIDIIESTQGEGVDMVIDCLDDNDLRKSTMECIGKKARYFIFCHNDLNTDFTFGMGIFLKEAAVMGFNPDMLLDMSTENKHTLVKMIEDGIRKGHVVPFDSTVIEGDYTRKQAIDSVISMTPRLGEGKKVILNIDRAVGQKIPNKTSTVVANKPDRRSYMIIGSYNSLWFDMVNWLATNGADKIFVLMEWNLVPIHTQIRFQSLLSKHTSLKVRFLEKDHLSSTDKLEQVIQDFRETLDKVFYIVPGLEKELETVDKALRKHSKDTWLVCMCCSRKNTVTQQRMKEGFKGVSLILKKESLKNKTIVNILHHFFNKSEQQDQLILMDEYDQETHVSLDNELDIFPRTGEEIVDLVIESSERPCFKELPTLTQPKKFSKELNPVFFFPGFRMSKMKYFISKFTYPSFIAKYPYNVKSYDETASHLTQELLKYDQQIYNLVAEGWAGPLALKVASLLEKNGRVAIIVLMDAFSSKINKWSKVICKSHNNVISRTISSLIKDEEVNVDQLRNCRDRIVDMISSKENLIEEEVRQGMDILMNRLQVLDTMKELDHAVASNVHLFTTRQDTLINHKELSSLRELCKVKCTDHVIVDATNDTLLESKDLLRDVRNLVVTEYKGQKQDINLTATLEVKSLR